MGLANPVHETGSRLDTGVSFTGGAGINFTSRLGLTGELTYNSLGVNPATLQLLFPNGEMRLWAFTANPVVRSNCSGRVDCYLIGGGGVYHRTMKFGQPVVATYTVYDPFGLTISARLAAAMDGKLWVESTLGDGSCFHFTICLEATTEEAAVIDEVSLSGMTILIIDDNLTNRQILTNLVSLWQARPTQAASAQEGLSLMRQAAEQGRPFALVLTDSHMPGMDGFDLVLQIRNSPHLAESVILMLTSAQRHGDLSRCKELGISGYLTKPVRRAELRSVISAAFARQEQTAKKAMPDCLKAPAPIARRILLAEDNLVNQRLATRLLEKEGHQVVVAANGLEALAAWRNQPFDLILTDIQMPEMDGFEATSEIRCAERGTNTRIPIVAMTAHAMTGDRQRCLSAGMDEYISKPIRKAELMETIARLTKQSGNVNLDRSSIVRWHP